MATTHFADLGRLKEVSVREVWSNEAKNFTPWLSENLDRLTEALGIELKMEKREMQVGSHRADIVARIPDHGARVLIENQLGQTDLKHLGQILAYLAGLEAQIVIWIAPDFRDDHLSAVRWLNQHTADPFAFIAVKVRTFKIECSPYAPTFQVLEQPDEWDRIVKDIRKSFEVHQFQRDFWAHCAARWPNSLGLSKGYANRRFRRWIEESDLKVTLYLARDRVRVYVTGNRDEPDEAVFPRIEPFRHTLVEALSGSSFLHGKNPRCTTEHLTDTLDRNNWDDMADWLDGQRKKYETVLRSGPGVLN